MSTVKLLASLLVAGVLGTIGTLSQAAPASQVVTIGNVPLPVNIPLLKYQETGGVTSNTCAPQCILSCAPVPAGKRLVLTHVSAQVSDDVEIVVIERPNSGAADALFVTKPYAGSQYISAPVTYYYEPGETPSARMFVTVPGNNSLIVTLVGYLVPAQ